MNFKELNDDTLSYGSDEHNLKNSINPTKRQKISVDFDLPDSSILQESLASAMNNKMAETVREMEKKLAKQMSKQFVQMWEKALDQFNASLSCPHVTSY